eukprot:gnl/Spiro4/29352_TR14372_c0_g1_i1.p1 gnl/Spiro4/29352_TR14372_c0_g1~~gnl/Spiro4/29352_TR14372_c0_g1_i1.p1  ORF type:complete len:456 (-),score=165.10 gnl/Spiro4/29352_TR14372_c0_g1_i1:104-1471(-)
MLALNLSRRSSQLAYQSLAVRSLFVSRGRKPPTVSPDEAVSVIESNHRVYVHGASAVPAHLLNALVRHAQERNLTGIELNQLHTNKPNPCAEARYAKHFKVNNFFVGGNMRKNVAEGHASLIPVFLSEIPKLIRSIKKPDVALLQVSPPDSHGYCSLGVEVCAAYAAVEQAQHLVAQINPCMPRTHGQSNVHIDCFDSVVLCEEPLVEHVEPPLTDVEKTIGSHIAALVPDGACLQVGIGGVPNAVLASLKNHKNLGVHTEMFSDGIVELSELGCINNSKKSFYHGRTVTAFVMGSQRLYDFIDDNPNVLFLDCATTNDPAVIGLNSKVVAINCAVEVDLTGQVCADSIGTRILSGVGGQVDFEHGAAISEGGIPIICLPSATSNGISRVVSTLATGAGVVTSRNHVHWVVTEYGAANLYGKNIHERARLMIDLAHPNHREKLAEEAHKRFGVLI